MSAAEEPSPLPRAIWKGGRLVAQSGGITEGIPTLFLMCSDGLACAISLAASSLLFSWIEQFPMVLLTSVISYGFGGALFGLYPGRGMLGPARLRLRAFLALVAFLSPGMVLLALHSHEANLDFLTCLAAGSMLALLGSLLELTTIWTADAYDLWRAPAVFMGSPEEKRRIARDLEIFPELGLKLVQDREAAPGAMDVISLKGLASRAASQTSYLVDPSAPLPALLPLHEIGASRDVSSGKFLAYALKRMMDFVLGAIGLILFSPVMIVTAFMIFLRDGTPIFYRQARGGKDGATIHVWKFRSMYRDAEQRLERLIQNDPSTRTEWERYFKLRDDPRILPGIGAFIRKTSIDELPQIWNVLTGDMSIVGPRPFPPEHLAAFSKEFRKLRSSVMPGITGLWQVTLRSDGDLEQQEYLDRAYIDGWSLWLDLYIILRTPLALLWVRGAR